MFEALQPAPPDKILALMAQFREDERENKTDLGVGVYKDQYGETVIMRSIRAAEKRLYDEQKTKTYVGLQGDKSFCAAMGELVLGNTVSPDNYRVCQAPGGSGALSIVAMMLNRARPGATVWISDPSWPNHIPLLAGAGLKPKSYPYYDPETGKIRFDEMIATLQEAEAGDILLLHGCCHNPTGADLTLDQWKAVTELCWDKGLFPFIDLAYLGFGDGLEEDAAGVRLMAKTVPECAIAASCSKNFAVYRERLGAAILVGADTKQLDTAFGQLLSVTRSVYSMPPDHGAAAVRIVLEDAELKADWKAELETMRTRMTVLRQDFADALRRESNSSRFDFIAGQKGMFSRLGLSPDQIDTLRNERGIYIVGDSRINIAGLPGDRLDELARAIVSVTG
ncbi:aromatic amino acid transaminase [Hoeflea prorocentri]|uniref:Aminotransferase n=1 Tax=Hoeflea prorocentri TaxID=1922333 RepID=A0A9X3UD93_9HYPH|nr:amino acid aminotransferase [Hoeflea prorocentri]MCY6379156.1 aspartate/tyrosine/aromatic aminotransferase [Hoeflea prorocentri]MDA5396957.1 aspartate/tyrosine/aromatic aminotransferase [Hoeflea prorocentri]